jgi:hypothetical protein
MPRKPLRQEEIPAGPVDVGDGSVPEGMEVVEAVNQVFRCLSDAVRWRKLSVLVLNPEINP